MVNIINLELIFETQSSKKKIYTNKSRLKKIKKSIKLWEKMKELLSRKKTYLFETMLEQ